MHRCRCAAFTVTLGLLALTIAAGAADPAQSSLKSDTPDIKTAGPLAFGPDGILFIGDSSSATIFAIDTGDRTAATSKDTPKLDNIDQKIASLLGIEAAQLIINDMAVNPISGNVYLSLSRGKGPDAKAALVKVDRAGKVTEVPFKGLKYAAAKLPNANPEKFKEKQRQDAVTDLAYVKDQVIIAGLSNEEFASTLRTIPFPFTDVNKGAGIEIFHGAHGKVETASPIRTFVPYEIDGQSHLLAAYQCTPLVKIPVSQLKPGQKVTGTTIAELGNGNRPLDMITYKKDGKDFLLLTNSNRGVMKIPTEGIAKAEGISKKADGPSGVKYETIGTLKGVMQLDKLDETHAIILVRTEKGDLNLQTIELP